MFCPKIQVNTQASNTYDFRKSRVPTSRLFDYLTIELKKQGNSARRTQQHAAQRSTMVPAAQSTAVVEVKARQTTYQGRPVVRTLVGREM